ncbi:MAG: cytochrome C [Proteobacteria bacterium]|nr:cytochrome C [Pseudomonadota bacterium]
MRYTLIVAITFIASFVTSAVDARYLKYKDIHSSSDFIRSSCRACHAGSRMNRSITETCLQCHSNDMKLEKAEKKKLLSSDYRILRDILSADISEALGKTYNHPVGEARGVHNPFETMPEDDSRTPRHVECTDCHNAHLMKKERPYAGIIGVGKGGMTGVQAVKEYEVCFRCHSDSMNLPVSQTNKREEFDEDNASFHPVVTEGKSTLVPSLIRPYRERAIDDGDISIIKCSNCHNNDDKNRAQGPHGSKYQFILSDNYSLQDDVDERPYRYELCYRCHKRSSILSDVTNFTHSLHIKGDILTNRRGTSCYTCHDAHGSKEYTHLIKFNEDVVFRNPSTGEFSFTDKGDFTGECSLMCHGSVHNPKSY